MGTLNKLTLRDKYLKLRLTDFRWQYSKSSNFLSQEVHLTFVNSTIGAILKRKCNGVWFWFI